jgi:alpha-beta hydrolase superfamily lysophospholipase
LLQDNHQLISIEAEDDTDVVLQVHLWPVTDAIGWLHIMHGVGEHGARYGALAKQLNPAGYNVSVGDYRGHGLTCVSDAQRGHVADHDGWNKLVADQATIIGHLQAQWTQPLTIFGHSMGTFVATHVVQRYAKRLKPHLKGLVLSSSSYRPPWLYRLGLITTVFERWRQGPLGRSSLIDRLTFGHYNNAFKPARTPKDWISSDNEVVDAYIADPLAGHDISNQFWFDLFHGLSDVHDPESMAKIDPNLPIYMFSGAKDLVGNQGGYVVALERALKRAGALDVTYKLYPNGRHEMINEPNKQQVIDDLLAWLGKDHDA